MADKEKELKTTRDAVTFEDDPEEYCKMVYAEALKHNKTLSVINLENRLFYEGRDKKLDDRANDKLVVRSALFVHELKPAIDTRVSDVITKVEEREFPITFRPAEHAPTLEQTEQALFIERTINEQMRDCGFLSEGFKDYILSAEMYRTPATVKVTWENVYEKQPVVDMPTEETILAAATRGKIPPRPRVRFENKFKGGRPCIELMSPDEFLYEPSVMNFQNESEYAIHAVWVSWGKLFAMGMEHDWDMAKLKKYKAEMETTEGAEDNDAFNDEVEAERGVDVEKGYRDGKVLVAEVYVNTYTDTGEEVINQVVMVGNAHMVRKPQVLYRGVKFPFVPTTPNRMPNSMEGLSSVDVGKELQRLYNEVFNSFLDGVTYRTFPPLVREPGTEFQKTPVWSPGAIWDVTNPEGLKPLIDNPGILPDLPSLMEAVSAKLRHVLNAEDISQGFQAQQYEKATATSLRASGSAKRAMPTNKIYGDALVKIAEMVLALNQQYHPEGFNFVLDVVVDVPSLTMISDPEAKKQESILLLSTVAAMELYQTPTGKLKVRNFMEDVIREFKKVDVKRYVPTEEELQGDMDAQREAVIAEMNKQSAMEEVAMASQGQPQ